MITGETAQAAWVAYLKNQPNIVALLRDALQIKEREWQGDDFVYPGIRVSLDLMPGEDSCFPDTMKVYLEVFSEEKSSKQASHIAGELTILLRNTASFSQNGIKFFMIHIKKIERPDRIESGVWLSTIEVEAKASG
jgi:hypothetical protein